MQDFERLQKTLRFKILWETDANRLWETLRNSGYFERLWEALRDSERLQETLKDFEGLEMTWREFERL